MGLEIIVAFQKDGHKVASTAFSPHKPQPTHPSVTCAIGSDFNGSVGGFTVRVGQPDSLIHEWSPVQVSSSTPYLILTKRFLSLSALYLTGFNRRCLSNWHSPSAIITFKPLKLLFKASNNTFLTAPTLYVWTVFSHSTPIPFNAFSIVWSVLVELSDTAKFHSSYSGVDYKSWVPVAEV